MKRLLLATLLLTSCALNKPGYTPKEPAIIRILDAQKNFMCSGSVISDKYVLTAAHCLGGAAFIQSRENSLIMVSVLSRVGNDRLDIALLISDLRQFEKERVDINPASILGTYFKRACGFPMGGELYCRNFTQTTRKYFQFSCPIDAYPGMSGGPVYSRWSGAVIGVISAVGPDGETLWSPAVELYKTLGVQP